MSESRIQEHLISSFGQGTKEASVIKLWGRGHSFLARLREGDIRLSGTMCYLGLSSGCEGILVVGIRECKAEGVGGRRGTTFSPLNLGADSKMSQRRGRGLDSWAKGNLKWEPTMWVD